MFSQVAAHLQGRVDHLLHGRYDRVAAHYLYPLPIYLGSSRIIVRSPEEAASVFCLLRSAYLERGVIAIHPRVTAIDLPRGGRFRAWVDWHEIAMPAEASRFSSTIYYLKSTPSGLRTEMVNYTQLSMPELNPHLVALALSA